jgi:hypothetical protein
VVEGRSYAHGDKFTEDHEDGDGADPYCDVAVDDTGGPPTVSISIGSCCYGEQLTFGSLQGTAFTDVSSEHDYGEMWYPTPENLPK